MNKLLSLLAPFMLVVSEAATAHENDAELFVFVGELLEIEELPDQCPRHEKPTEIKSTEDGIAIDSICIQFDALYRASYRVVDILVGSADSEIVTFEIADHYGFPDFAYFKNALLFLNDGPDAIWLEKYQGYAVHRTRDQSWATCGNPYDERTGNQPRKLVQPQFENDLGTVGEFSEAGVRRVFGDRPHIIIDENRVRCGAGVLIAEFYEIVRTGVLAARGIQLPKLSTVENEL